MIPFFDLKEQYLSIRDEIDLAVRGVIESGSFILGSRLEEFEEAFAGYLGVKHVIGVGSGTEALHLSLVAAGVGSGDEVITASNTAVPTVAAIRAAGAVPVLVDVNPSTLLIDPEGLELAIKKRASGRLKAVIPVHLYGNFAPMEEILEVSSRYGLRVIEDACQAHGSEYRGKKAGTFGDAGCFSFYPTKNLGAYGDGGAVSTNSPEMQGRLRLLRNYGQKDRYHAVSEGINSRLDEMQAAVLSVKLKHLEGWNEKRRSLAGVYKSSLDPSRVRLTGAEEGVKENFHLFVIRHERRDGLRRFLEAKGIATLIHYPLPIHLQEAYRHLGAPGSFPRAEEAAREIISLPMYPELGAERVREVASRINSFPG